jgi:hypothetical protein
MRPRRVMGPVMATRPRDSVTVGIREMRRSWRGEASVGLLAVRRLGMCLVRPFSSPTVGNGGVAVGPAKWFQVELQESRTTSRGDWVE